MIQFYSPLRYPGGKTCNYNFIISLFDENNIKDISYVEPYAGGAGLALKLLCTNKVNKIYLNDYDKALYCFWKVILNQTDEFCDWIRKVNIDIETWKEYKKVQADKETASDIMIAKSTFFLNRCNISGVLKGGVIGGQQQSGKYKMDARFNKNDLIDKIIKISKYKEKIILSNDDGINFLYKINKINENIFIYLDPPYYKKGSELYLNFYKKDDHNSLASAISKIKKNWIMSYDNEEFIKKLYINNRMVVYNLKQSTSNKIGDEILIFDGTLSFNNSITKLVNANIVEH